jgi:hypothetical protein
VGYIVTPMSLGRPPTIPAVLAVFTLLTLVPLVAWDVAPDVFPARAHEVVSAVPLTVVALAYLAYQAVRRVSLLEFAKALLSAGAFLFWALNQLLPDHPRATLFNDIAVAAFVLDVVLVIAGWPPAREGEPDKTEAQTVSDAPMGE